MRTPNEFPQSTPLDHPDWLAESVWPFNTELRVANGLRIALADAKREGPNLLFVHTRLWSFLWRDVLLRLAGEFRCVCFDAPGTWLSGLLPNTEINLSRATTAVRTGIESPDLRYIMLALHDLGGPSGIAGAAKAAERIKSLCVVNAFGSKPSGRAFRGMLAVMGNPVTREFGVAARLVLGISSTAFGSSAGCHSSRRDRPSLCESNQTVHPKVERNSVEEKAQ